MAAAILSDTGYIEKLKALLSFAEQYNEMTKEQEKAIKDDDADGLLASLKRRGELIVEIDRINAEISRTEKDGGGKKRSGEAEILANSARELFSEALALDKKNTAAVKGLMSQVSEHGKNIAKSRDGISKYAQKSMQFSPGYFDQRQ